jgi:hypothetical protein
MAPVDVQPRSIAAGLAIQTYWAAAGRAWSLGTLAAQTLDANEQGALRELMAGEELRRDQAVRLLAEVWDIKLGGE